MPNLDLISHVEIREAQGYGWLELHFWTQEKMAQDFKYSKKEIREGRSFRKNWVYFAETVDGWVRFYVYDPSNQHGFGGRTFTLAMVDGSEEKIVGPWSGRPAVMLEVGFTPCIEVHVHNNEEPLLSYYSHITVDCAKNILETWDHDYKIVLGSKNQGESCFVIKKISDNYREDEDVTNEND